MTTRNIEPAHRRHNFCPGYEWNAGSWLFSTRNNFSKGRQYPTAEHYLITQSHFGLQLIVTFISCSLVLMLLLPGVQHFILSIAWMIFFFYHNKKNSESWSEFVVQQEWSVEQTLHKRRKYLMLVSAAKAGRCTATRFEWLSSWGTHRACIKLLFYVMHYITTCRHQIHTSQLI